MPRSSRALLPARIRTRFRRSGVGPMLSWAFAPLQSVSHPPWNRLPGSFLPALSAAALREDDSAALQGLAARMGRGLPHGSARLS
jgi:hypothetical protein